MNAVVSDGTCVLGDTGTSPSFESALLPLLPAGPCPSALWDASGFPENSGMWDSGQQAAGSRKRKKIEVRHLVLVFLWLLIVQAGL